VCSEYFQNLFVMLCAQLHSVYVCIIAGSYDGCVYCIDLHTGAIRWSFHTKGLVKSSPALCLNGSAIVIGSYDQFLYCINILVCWLICRS
jgi:hypothetical protein